MRTTNRTSNRLAPHSVLRVLLGSIDANRRLNLDLDLIAGEASEPLFFHLDAVGSRN